MNNEQPRTDTQKLKAMIYANGLTLAEFSAIVGRSPATMEKRLNGEADTWGLGDIDNLNRAMKAIDPTYKEEELETVFFADTHRHAFAKPYFLAVCEIGQGITEGEAAERAGIDLETLRSLYNACDTTDKLELAAKVWKAIGVSGHWHGFYLSFLDFDQTPKA